MNSTGCLIELHYLPSQAWFSAVHSYPEIILERHERYVKQSYRNRCHILGANRVEKLIIPVTVKQTSALVTDLRIDYTQKWLNNHWRSIESAYRNAPYFEHYADAFHQVLFGKHPHLYELNYRLLKVCFELLNRNVAIRESVVYETLPTNGAVDLRNQVSPKHAGHEKYMQPVAYTQVFGNSFVPNLSIIDLLFCTGPEAVGVIETACVHQ
ncbi:WbqC family protein [Oscillatoria amoena NRMC-F 0135]|nr:WbqC family protein [Oscillatoria amoena NRMC-F 0135]